MSRMSSVPNSRAGFSVVHHASLPQRKYYNSPEGFQVPCGSRTAGCTSFLCLVCLRTSGQSLAFQGPLTSLVTLNKASKANLLFVPVPLTFLLWIGAWNEGGSLSASSLFVNRRPSVRCSGGLGRVNGGWTKDNLKKYGLPTKSSCTLTRLGFSMNKRLHNAKANSCFENWDKTHPLSNWCD